MARGELVAPERREAEETAATVLLLSLTGVWDGYTPQFPPTHHMVGRVLVDAGLLSKQKLGGPSMKGPGNQRSEWRWDRRRGAGEGSSKPGRPLDTETGVLSSRYC